MAITSRNSVCTRRPSVAVYGGRTSLSCSYHGKHAGGVCADSHKYPIACRFDSVFLEDSGATAAIVSENFQSLLNDEMIETFPCQIILSAQRRSWASESTLLLEYPTSRRDQAFWMYSSGSIGRPKGIIHRHEDAPYTAETHGVNILKLRLDDICFSISKIFFAYGFGNSVSFPMSCGAATVLLSGRPTPESVFEQIVKHRPTVLFGLPTIYTAFAYSAVAETADLSFVRLCISAAEFYPRN